MEITNAGIYNNPYFGAKLHILGQKETIKKNLIPIIEAKVSKIGHGDDLVVLYFGKPMLEVLHGPEGRILQQCRSIYAKSIINKVSQEKDISYCIFHNDLEDSKMITQSVSEYLHNLSSSLKARRRIKK